MSFGDRLYRIARRRVREGLGLGGEPDRYSDARAELEEHLRSPSPPRQPPGPAGAAAAPPPHPYTREYRLLGAPVGSDLKTVQACWRRLVRATHPDRFAGDPAEEQRANERLRRINDAYERLKSHFEP